MMRPAYLEPRTDVPAVEDWSTRLFLDEDKTFGRVADAMAVGSLTVAVSLVVFPEATPGTVAVVVVLALLGLLMALASLVHRHEWAPRRRGLLDRPWRRVPATVAAGGTWEEERLLLFTEGGTVVLRGTLPDVTTLVLDRQEVFLCGPDDKGRAEVRVAGLCRLYPMRVEEIEAADVRPREREPHLIGRPLDDEVVARAFRGFRWGTRAWVWPTASTVVGAAMVSLSVTPLSPAGLVVGGLLIVAAAILSPGVVMICKLYREAVAAAESAVKWTPVPVTLFPWESEHEVAGLAQLPTGTAVVRFPLPNPDLIANIAETGTMWMAGDGGGVITVGLPRVPALMPAMVERDRDVPEENPHPWLLRAMEPSWDGVPALRG
ncbi:hypothetical protein ACRAKI_07850 [Saccharothrix isguenensis]